MGRFDSKTFNPEAFGRYVKTIPNTKRNELAKSAVIGRNEEARNALASQTGSIYATVPYFGRISASTSQNNDGASDITASTTTTFAQGFVVASRMDAWTERSFSKNITAGVDFMDNVAAQISDYKFEVMQNIMLSILKGIYAMKTSGSGAAEKAAKEFVENHTHDISLLDIGTVNASTLNTAIQKACGDNKAVFKLAFMHSAVATNLENEKLLKYLTYTDSEGIERELNLATWNGRLVFVDDSLPVESFTAGYTKSSKGVPGALKVIADAAETVNEGEIKLASVTPKIGGYTPKEGDYTLYVEAGNKYTTFVLGEGAINLDDIGDAVPYEMSRDAAKNGGEDTLYVRDRYVIGFEGISYKQPSTVSVSNTDLETGDNWSVINDGETAIETKLIPVTRIISRG